MPKRKNSDAPVWEHFTRYQESGNCVCHYCPKSYKLTTAANSHSSLWYHVKNKHPNKMISSGNASESEQESTLLSPLLSIFYPSIKNKNQTDKKKFEIISYIYKLYL